MVCHAQHGYLNFTSFRKFVWHMRSNLFRAQMHAFCETRRETDSSASRVSSVCAAPLMYKVPRRQSCRKWCCFPRKMLVRSWLELRRWLSNLPCAFGIVFSSFQVLCDFSEYIWLSRMSEQLMKFRIVCEISLLAVDYALRRTEDGHCIFTFNPV